MEIQQGIAEEGASIGGNVSGGTTGSVLFVGPGATLAQDNANFFWDDTNNRLGIRTNVPTGPLTVDLNLEQPFGINNDGVATFPHSLGSGYSYLRAPANRGFRFQSGPTNAGILLDFPTNKAGSITLGYRTTGIGDDSSPGVSIYLHSVGISDLNLRAGDGDPTRTADILFSVRNNMEVARFTDTGNMGIGTVPDANAILDVASTTKAFLPPRMTTTQKNAIASPTAGMVVYDTTLAKLCVYTTTWETITSI